MTRTLILAAGEGTRLRPLTEFLPKTLVPLDGESLLARQMKVNQRAGIDDISIVTGHCASALKASGARLFHNPRYASTNMVESLSCARSLFDGSDDIVVAYGDIAYEPRLLESVLAAEAPISVVVDVGWRQLWELRMDDPLSDAETMKLDVGGRIVELGEKPSSMDDIQGQYIGLFKVSRRFAPLFFEAYDRLPAFPLHGGRPREKIFMTAHLQNHINAGVEVLAAKVEHGWLEVDSVQDLLRYEAALADGRLQHLYDGHA